MSNYDWENSIERIENGIDLSILYLSIANDPDASKEIRNVFNDFIKIYLKNNNTSIKEIWKRNQARLEEKK